MPTVWRLAKTKYAERPFDGEGSRLYGGRWSSPGTVVAYGAESQALAVLELLVHLQDSALLESFSIARAEVPQDLVEVLESKELPANWRESPAPAETQAIGDKWVRQQRSVVLQVPSVILTGAHNYLLNPAHPAFSTIKISGPDPFLLDSRLRRSK